MGACHHIDTVRCENCRHAVSGMRWPFIGPGEIVEMPSRIYDDQAAMQRFIDEMQRYQYKPRDRDQQDAAWRDLAGL